MFNRSVKESVRRKFGSLVLNGQRFKIVDIHSPAPTIRFTLLSEFLWLNGVTGWDLRNALEVKL